jgi:hypothetical protein
MQLASVQCSPWLMGEMKKSSVFECHKQFKESSHVKITNEDNAHHFHRYQGMVHFEFIPSTRLNSQLSLLCGNIEAVK